MVILEKGLKIRRKIGKSVVVVVDGRGDGGGGIMGGGGWGGGRRVGGGSELIFLLRFFLPNNLYHQICLTFSYPFFLVFDCLRV